jgi:hypothetical protein
VSAPARGAGRLSGRRLTGAALALLCAASPPSGAQAVAPARLYLFLPGAARPAALEALLREHLPGVEVTAFGRVADFTREVEARPPDGVLAPRAAFEELGLQPSLRGLARGQGEEEWVLVAADARPEPAALVGQGKVFGLINLVGRKRLPALAQALLGVAGEVRVSSVPRAEELLSLLQVGGADAVLVPESALRDLASRSLLDLQVTRLPRARVGLPALALLKPQSAPSLEAAIRSLDRAVLARLGIEEWQR